MAISIAPIEAEFPYIDSSGNKAWAPCTVIGVECDGTDRPILVCLTVGRHGLLGALTLSEVRPVEHQPLRHIGK
jgi:hypothetical protein